MNNLIYRAILVIGASAAAAAHGASQAQVAGQQHDAASPQASLAPAELRSEAKTNRSFGIRLYKELAKNPGNVFISPVSIAAAFGPVALGARADTYMAIGRTLGFRGDPQLSSKRTGGLLRAVRTTEEDEGAKVSIANALWLTESFPLKADFVTAARSDFDAGVETLEFRNSPAAAARINEWVESETKGKIPKLFELDAFDDKTALVVTNAVHFLGDWTQPFIASLTRPEPFYLTGGKQRSVPLMSGDKTARYIETEKLQMIELPYKGDAFSMVAILPKDRGGLPALEAQMTDATLDAWLGKLDSAETQSIVVQLPKLTIDSDYQLADPLKAMGMEIAFDRHRANFRGMSDQQLWISDVVHKTFLRIDEKGTEAAAATGVVMRGESSGPELAFRADHPFLVLIRDRQTGAILFLGRIAEP